MTPEQNIALECACSLSAFLMEGHEDAEDTCCCESLGAQLAEFLRQAPTQSLALLRSLRDGTEDRPCECCTRTCGFIRAALMHYEYELSKAQIKAILGT